MGWGATSCNTFRFLTQQYNNLKFSIFCAFGVFRSPRIPLCQGTPYVFWENSVCFSRPGFNDTQEVRYCFVVVVLYLNQNHLSISQVCICTRDGCNKDYTSSRATYAYYPRLGEHPNVTSGDGQSTSVLSFEKNQVKFDQERSKRLWVAGRF